MKRLTMLLKYFVNRIARISPKLILLIFAPVWLTACAAAPKVITEYEIKEIEVAVRTPLDEKLLQHPAPCQIPPTLSFYIFDLDQWAACLETKVEFYARQLERIKEANNLPLNGADLDTGGGGQ